MDDGAGWYEGEAEGAARSEAASVEEASRGSKAARPRHGRRRSVAEKKTILEQASADGVSAAAKASGATHWSIYDWQRRCRRAIAAKGDAEAALAPGSSRPKHITGKFSEERHHLIAPPKIKVERRPSPRPRPSRRLVRRARPLSIRTSMRRPLPVKRQVTL